MFHEIKIAPSILSGNFMDMGSSIRLIEESGADWVHVDVMDGHFVPNITMGVPMVKQLRAQTELTIDAHLMVSNPLDQIPWFLDAGADYITFHIEAVDEIEAQKCIDLIHEGGRKAGISLKPKTSLEDVAPFIDKVDMILVMSVEPGFSGQSFIEGSNDRIKALAELADQLNPAPLIQVDGGIGEITAFEVGKAGADILVCGNAFFGAEDAKAACRLIRKLALEGKAEIMRVKP